MEEARQMVIGFDEEVNVPTKKCKKCGVVKTYDHFSICNSAKDGKQAWCRECHRYDYRQRLKRIGAQPVLVKVPSAPLEEASDEMLIAEMRRRGYKGQLTYTKSL